MTSLEVVAGMEFPPGSGIFMDQCPYTQKCPIIRSIVKPVEGEVIDKALEDFYFEVCTGYGGKCPQRTKFYGEENN